MAGHSHSSNIWGTKTVNDLKRAKAFTRISKDIANAVKIGGGSDPSTNALLRTAVDRAKAVNIPQDRVQRAIDKASGKSGDREVIYQKIYEILAPSNVFLLVEAETDNPTRTIAEIKLVVSRSGYKLLEVGSALRFFKEVGELKLAYKQGYESDNLLDKIISTSGIIDYQLDSNKINLLIEKDFFSEVVTRFNEDNQLAVESARIIFTNNINRITDEVRSELEDFKSKLLDLSDVIEVWY